MKKQIKLGLPTKIEIILLLLIVVSLFFIDINQNKVIDKGIQYQTTWLSGVTTSAITNFWIGIFVYLILYISILITAISIAQRKTHHIWNVVISAIGVFGLVFIVSGFLAELNKFSVPFFSLMITSINFYHIGIGICVLAPLIIALTE